MKVSDRDTAKPDVHSIDRDRSMFLWVESYGHEYLIVPSEVLEGVRDTEPPGGMADSWGEYGDYTELSPDLVAKVAALRGPDAEPVSYGQPLRFPPGHFVIIEWVPRFGIWSLMTDMIFRDADDAQGWLTEEAGPPDRFTEYVGDTTVLDKDMPLQLRTHRADPEMKN